MFAFSDGWPSTGSVKLLEGVAASWDCRAPWLPRYPVLSPAGAMVDWMTAAPLEHHNNHVHPLLATAVLPACNKRATVKMTDLINATTTPGALQ